MKNSVKYVRMNLCERDRTHFFENPLQIGQMTNDCTENPSKVSIQEEECWKQTLGL